MTERKNGERKREGKAKAAERDAAAKQQQESQGRACLASKHIHFHSKSMLASLPSSFTTTTTRWLPTCHAGVCFFSTSGPPLPPNHLAGLCCAAVAVQLLVQASGFLRLQGPIQLYGHAHEVLRKTMTLELKTSTRSEGAWGL